jgi:acyl carrier protein
MEKAGLLSNLQSTAAEPTQPVLRSDCIGELPCLQESLTSLFRDELQVEIASPDVDLFATGVLDSLKIAELLNCLETRFGAQIGLDDLEYSNFRSIGEIARLLVDRKRDIWVGK